MSDQEDMMAGPRAPRGTVGRQRGWQGEELEMAHKREGLATGRDKKSTAAAVDIQQFQNHDVGQGYQARHVVRQPSAHTSNRMEVRDMSGGKFNEKEETKKIVDSGDREYLQNKGLRDFRKEIESILASP